jgi:hypothetical protein
VSELRGISELSAVLGKDGAARQGCLVDNSILFALSYPLDTFNEDAEKSFDTLAKQSVPVFTNVNIRTEFTRIRG